MILVIAIFIIMEYFDVRELINKKYWNEIVVSIIFFFFADCLAIAYMAGVPILNLAKIQEFIVKDVLHLNYK